MTGDAAIAFGFAAALLAAVLDGVATVLQATAAQHTGSSLPVRAALYGAGLVVDVLGWGVAVFALRFLPVFAVQSIVAGQTAIAVLLARVVLRSALHKVDLFGIAAAGAGLGLLAAGATGSTGWSAPPPVVLAVLLILFVVLLVAGLSALRRGTVARSVVAGCAYGGSVLAVRALLLRPGATSSVDALLAQPLTYVTIGFAALGIPLYAAALRRSTPTVPSAIVTMIEVVVPGALAMILLGDRIRPGWWWLSGIGLVLAALGVTALVVRDANAQAHLGANARVPPHVAAVAVRRDIAPEALPDAKDESAVQPTRGHSRVPLPGEGA
ncbi:hypothetical protein [Amycolatopsis sp. NPDC049159]|uniref:hypothetical protein n=1 Tax=Amycolatopsis sp. NPDC049159 TaxID=3157210 RepID=UPI00340DD2EF